MNNTAKVQNFATPRTVLGLYTPPVSDTNTAYWRIDGFRAAIIIWTVEEWESLNVRPLDAQFHPCGVWCALRVL
jgi:hypothetical protein